MVEELKAVVSAELPGGRFAEVWMINFRIWRITVAPFRGSWDLIDNF